MVLPYRKKRRKKTLHKKCSCKEALAQGSSLLEREEKCETKRKKQGILASEVAQEMGQHNFEYSLRFIENTKIKKNL